MHEIRIQPMSGGELQRCLPALAELRIEIFRDFPYLYEGSREYEERYLGVYAAAPQSFIVAAFAADLLVGAATALPLECEPASVNLPVREAGYDPHRVFYFGESVLRRNYRGRGIGVRFFAEREAHARSFGSIDHAMFCAVVRPTDDPRRPPGFTPLDGFWMNRGYRKLEGVMGSMSWRDVGAVEATAKPMQFWGRRIRD